MKLHKIILTILLLSIFSLSQVWAETSTEKQAEPSKGTVLITGANRGLGLEFAKQYKKLGYKVYGSARKPETATELKDTGAHVVQLDVTSMESITAMKKSIGDQPIDILINNAGYFGPNKIGTKQSTLSNIEQSELLSTFQVNAMGPMFVSQALMKNVIAAEKGKIINIATRSGIISKKPRSGAYGYRMSKASLNMLTRTMAAEPSLKDTIVISLAPGHNKTDMGTDRGKLEPSVSVPLMIKLIDTFTIKNSGNFYYYNGDILPW